MSRSAGGAEPRAAMLPRQAMLECGWRPHPCLGVLWHSAGVLFAAAVLMSSRAAAPGCCRLTVNG